MSSGEASGKPWMPKYRAEDLARFADNTRDLEGEYLDQDGEPMSSDEWIEAKADLDYTVVAMDFVGPLAIATSWIGVHFQGREGWERVVFGTQVIHVDSEKLARKLAGPPGSAELGLERPSEPFDLMDIDELGIGEVLSRFAWKSRSDAETGHGWVVDMCTTRFREEGLIE